MGTFEKYKIFLYLSKRITPNRGKILYFSSLLLSGDEKYKLRYKLIHEHSMIRYVFNILTDCLS